MSAYLSACSDLQATISLPVGGSEAAYTVRSVEACSG